MQENNGPNFRRKLAADILVSLDKSSPANPLDAEIRQLISLLPKPKPKKKRSERRITDLEI